MPVSSRPYIVQVGMRVVMEHCTMLRRVNTLLQTGSRTFEMNKNGHYSTLFHVSPEHVLYGVRTATSEQPAV